MYLVDQRKDLLGIHLKVPPPSPPPRLDDSQPLPLKTVLIKQKLNEDYLITSYNIRKGCWIVKINKPLITIKLGKCLILENIVATPQPSAVLTLRTAQKKSFASPGNSKWLINLLDSCF